MQRQDKGRNSPRSRLVGKEQLLFVILSCIDKIISSLVLTHCSSCIFRSSHYNCTRECARLGLACWHSLRTFSLLTKPKTARFFRGINESFQDRFSLKRLVTLLGNTAWITGWWSNTYLIQSVYRHQGPASDANWVHEQSSILAFLSLRCLFHIFSSCSGSFLRFSWEKKNKTVYFFSSFWHRAFETLYSTTKKIIEIVTTKVFWRKMNKLERK